LKFAAVLFSSQFASPSRPQKLALVTCNLTTAYQKQFVFWCTLYLPVFVDVYVSRISRSAIDEILCSFHRV